jgi:hypothetical protein
MELLLCKEVKEKLVALNSMLATSERVEGPKICGGQQ